MRCTTCDDPLNPSDTRYEAVTPVEGGGQTTSEYCSVACLNQDVGFDDEDIESLMRQAGYEVPPDLNSSWLLIQESEIDDLHFDSYPYNGEYFQVFDHVEKNYSIEVYHEPAEQLYEVVLHTYDVVDGERVGLEEIDKTYTAVHQRALAYAEEFMDRVEEGRVE